MGHARADTQKGTESEAQFFATRGGATVIDCVCHEKVAGDGWMDGYDGYYRCTYHEDDTIHVEAVFEAASVKRVRFQIEMDSSSTEDIYVHE